ncbi:MAG: hypothetical protein HY735_07460 [Verrucomicrobia bacterium]|nr:hypothetical protein [Verrucomicrobiota bacterium]
MINPSPESDARWTRRHFLYSATALTLGAAGRQGLRAAAESNASAAVPERSAIGEPGTRQASLIQIGILLGTFARGDLEARLDAVRECGLDCVQVSLDCAGLPAMPEEIPAKVAARIRREAAARGITIASVQGTFNMTHPGAEHRGDGPASAPGPG